MYEILKAKTLIFLLFYSSKINKISRDFHIFKMYKMQTAITNTQMEDRKCENTKKHENVLVYSAYVYACVFQSSRLFKELVFLMNYLCH